MPASGDVSSFFVASRIEDATAHLEKKIASLVTEAAQAQSASVERLGQAHDETQRALKELRRSEGARQLFITKIEGLENLLADSSLENEALRKLLGEHTTRQEAEAATPSSQDLGAEKRAREAGAGRSAQDGRKTKSSGATPVGRLMPEKLRPWRY